MHVRCFSVQKRQKIKVSMDPYLDAGKRAGMTVLSQKPEVTPRFANVALVEMLCPLANISPFIQVTF